MEVWWKEGNLESKVIVGNVFENLSGIGILFLLNKMFMSVRREIIKFTTCKIHVCE